ncbi:MAG: PLP-dependent transferase, partial [Myxococcales bacterium]
ADGLAARRVYDRFGVFVRAASLGEVSSLVTHPASFSHKGVPAAERARLGIGDGLLRLSIGIEDERDLEADLAQALEGIT